MCSLHSPFLPARIPPAAKLGRDSFAPVPRRPVGQRPAPNQPCHAHSKAVRLPQRASPFTTPVSVTRPFADHTNRANGPPLIKLPIRPPPRGHACYRRRLSACLLDIFISVELHGTGCHSRFSPRSHQGFDHIAPTLSRLLACSPTLLPSRPGATGNGQTGQSFPR